MSFSAAAATSRLRLAIFIIAILNPDSGHCFEVEKLNDRDGSCSTVLSQVSITATTVATAATSAYAQAQAAASAMVLATTNAQAAAKALATAQAYAKTAATASSNAQIQHALGSCQPSNVLGNDFQCATIKSSLSVSACASSTASACAMAQAASNAASAAFAAAQSAAAACAAADAVATATMYTYAKALSQACLPPASCCNCLSDMVALDVQVKTSVKAAANATAWARESVWVTSMASAQAAASASAAASSAAGAASSSGAAGYTCASAACCCSKQPCGGGNTVAPTTPPPKGPSSPPPPTSGSARFFANGGIPCAPIWKYQSLFTGNTVFGPYNGCSILNVPGFLPIPSCAVSVNANQVASTTINCATAANCGPTKSGKTCVEFSYGGVTYPAGTCTYSGIPLGKGCPWCATAPGGSITTGASFDYCNCNCCEF